MKKMRYHIISWLAHGVVVLSSVLFLVVVVYGATTVGNNINTDGNVDINGRASTTSATSTTYVYVGSDITEPPGFDFAGDVIASDDLYVNSQATTSASLWVGSGGTADSINLAGGDLYVQDDVEVDGSATTTSLYLSNDLTLAGNASTTGDVFVKGGTLSVATGTPTTTAGFFVGPTAGTGTTTIGAGNQAQVGCIELTREVGGGAGLFYRVYINDQGTGLQVETGRCN